MRMTNVRGALVLSVLLLTIVSSAIVVSIRIYQQLDSSARLQRVLVVAQQQLDDIVNIQLEQETALRGYLATGDALFLGPYQRGFDGYGVALDRFASTTKPLDLPDIDASIRQMRRLHESWTAEVADPLLRDPHAKDTLTRETLGKIVVDQIRGDTARIRRMIESDLAQAQEQLRRGIDLALIGGLAAVLVFGTVSILFVSSSVQMQATIDRERSIVETLEGAFRTDLDVLPGSRVGTAYVSADLDAAVGGDLYDVRRLDETRGLLIVADVSGKGIAAAVNTAFVKYSVRTLAREYRRPADILDRFNEMFLETVGDPNLFVVAFVGILDSEAKTLEYASAGHAGAFLRRGRDVRTLAVTGPVVGLDRSFRYGETTVALEAGDLLVLATDGLTEARDRDGALLDDRGAADLVRDASLDPQTCANEIVSAVRERGRGEVRDDLALLAIAIDPTARA